MNRISLIAENLKVNYDRQIALNIEKINLQGNAIAILGHNGAGKSTLLKTILELLVPQQGYVKASDSNGHKLKPEKDMAFCPENGAVFEDIQVEDYLKVWLRIKSLNDNLADNDTTELIELFKVEPLLKKYGRELSKGQRRRVQSVVGFITKPGLFLFDEPFDGLDIQKTAELTAILERWKETTNFLISSHRMDVIERVCDSGIVLANGSIVASGSIQELPVQLAGKSIYAKLPAGYEFRKDPGLSDCYISHIGQTLIFTGFNCEKEKIKKEFKLQDSDIVETVPSLTDAMAYHLQKL